MTLTAEDTQEINQLIYRYSYAVDERDWDAMADIFTPDAVFDSSAMGLAPVTGLPAIVAHLSKRSVPTAHLFTNLVVTEEDGEVFVKARGLNPDPEGRIVVSVVREKVVRTPAGWRIAAQTAVSLLRPGPEIVRS